MITALRYLEHTPVEAYRVQGRTIYVKRDDLYVSPPAPPLAKLRGLRVLLERLRQTSADLVGCFQTRVSNVGHGLAAACLDFPSLRCVVVCPQSKSHPLPESVKAARSLGAQIHFVPANRLSINYTQARRHVEQVGGVMLPFGMECPEAVQSIAAEAVHLPRDLVRGATVIVSCGSGVTLAGLLRGLPAPPRRLVGISSGRAPAQIERCVTRHVGKLPNNVVIYPPTIPYHDSPDLDCPFPCHPNYDLKAWEYLVNNLHQYEDPILFWNVGG